MMTKQIAVYGRTSKEYKNVEKVSIDQQAEDGIAFALAKKLTGKAVEYLDLDRPQRLPPRQWADGQRRVREGLTALITDIESGKIHAVIVRKIDRLFRNTENLMRFLRLLQEHNVRLMATHEQLPEQGDDSGMFTLTVLAAAAEYELKKISSNTKAGLAYITRHGGKTHPAI